MSALSRFMNSPPRWFLVGRPKGASSHFCKILDGPFDHHAVAMLAYQERQERAEPGWEYTLVDIRFRSDYD